MKLVLVKLKVIVLARFSSKKSILYGKENGESVLVYCFWMRAVLKMYRDLTCFKEPKLLLESYTAGEASPFTNSASDFEAFPLIHYSV